MANRMDSFKMACAVAAAMVVLLAVSSAQAVDGVVEINQAKALAGGVTARDQPGFPVFITDTTGSFRLTSNLVVPDADTDAIIVSAFDPAHADVTIDLNGFSILGPVECTRNAGETSCSASGSGDGIVVGTSGVSLTVMNGTIRGMGNDGLQATFFPARTRIHNVSALSNARSGFSVLLSQITDSRAELNGGDGVRASEDGGLITGCVLSLNGNYGISSTPGNGIGRNSFLDNTAGPYSAGVPLGVNICSGTPCAAPALQRRFYLTQEGRDGADARNVCAAGYHMASLWEIHDTSQLRYDTALGYTLTDSGSGPPGQTYGWIRTGNLGATGSEAGVANCGNYSLNDAASFGTAVALGWGAWTIVAQDSSPFIALATPCSAQRRVWCVEN